MSTRSVRRWTTTIAVSLATVTTLAACTDVADPSADTIAPVATDVPTTVVTVGFLDVTGFSYCEVADEVAGDIRVYADPSSDFGDPTAARDAFVSALRAFDALTQVAPDQVKADAALMRQTLDDTVKAASQVDWDVTQISGTAAHGVDPTKVAAALAKLHRYTLDQCKIDILEPDSPRTTALNETPEQRIRRVLADLFPDLDETKIACLEPRLPLDFDPQSDLFDQNVLLHAFAGCRIDINNPGTPTSVAPAPFNGPRPTTPTVTTIPTLTSSETS